MEIVVAFLVGGGEAHCIKDPIFDHVIYPADGACEMEEVGGGNHFPFHFSFPDRS